MGAIALTRQKLQAGDVVAKQGAWDRRYYIHYVKQIRNDTNTWAQRTYVVGMQLIGNYYATGEVIPPRRTPKIIEQVMWGDENGVSNYNYTVVHDNKHQIPEAV